MGGQRGNSKQDTDWIISYYCTKTPRCFNHRKIKYLVSMFTALKSYPHPYIYELISKYYMSHPFCFNCNKAPNPYLLHAHCSPNTAWNSSISYSLWSSFPSVSCIVVYCFSITISYQPIWNSCIRNYSMLPLVHVVVNTLWNCVCYPWHSLSAPKSHKLYLH